MTASKATDSGQKPKRIQTPQRVSLVLLLLLATMVVVGVARSRGGDETASTARVNAVARVDKLLKGVPQKGAVLGSPNAPVTLVEFVDLGCPHCRTFGNTALTPLVNRYVRKGKLRIAMKTLSFVSPDSVTAGKAAAGAKAQNRMWNFVALFFHNQGDESTEPLSSNLVKGIYNGIGDIDVKKALTTASGPNAQAVLDGDSATATQHGVKTVPTFMLGRTGKKLKKTDFESTDSQRLFKAIDKLLA